MAGGRPGWSGTMWERGRFLEGAHWGFAGPSAHTFTLALNDNLLSL